MIIPKGETVYQNLSTEYTDLPQLLLTLKPKGFSGIVEIDMAGNKGAFFVVSGDVVNAAAGIENDPPTIVGEEAIEKLLTLSTQPNGVLNVYQAPPIEVEFAASSLVKAEPLFKDLSTDFVKIDQFIKKLQNERLSGYIEIFSKTKRPAARLSFKTGEITGLQVISESGVPSFFERKATLPRLEEVVKPGVFFNVYRTENFSMPVKGINRSAESDVRVAEIKKHKFEPLETRDIKPEEILETKTEAKPAPVKGTDFVEKQKNNDDSGNDRNEFLTAIQRIFSKMEKFTDSVSEKGSFQKAFKRACVEKSESYHFLDPFEGQFEYQGKKIRLDAGIGTEEFIAAIGTCLNHTLTLLKKDLPKNVILPAGLKGDIESAFKQYQNISFPVFNS
jgi:hypothetical protein